MISRRDTLRALAAAGLAAPVATACGDRASGPAREVGGMRLVSADVPRSAGDPGAVPGVVAAMAAFTTDLWGAVPETGNLALSPYSIAVALAMTANGAAGETRRQMLDVLHVGSLAVYNSGLAALTAQVEGLAGPVTLADGKPGEIELAAANALFGDRGTRWQRPFLTVLARQYGAGMRVVDWRSATEAGRRAVNAWTSSQTHDRIPQILPAGSVDPSTRLVLVDALYCKAPWRTPFEPDLTTRRPFRVDGGSTASVEMMSGSDGLAFVRGPSYRGARLPYAGGALAMTVALPDGDEPAALRDLLGGLARQPGPHPVALSMPRWTFRVATDLHDPLAGLGMTLAFGDRADFSAMTADIGLYVSGVLHQTFVAVDEAGTEAAAATAVVMDALAAVADPEVLVLDRPFLFVVHDVRHGTPLFVGRVGDPTSA